MKREITLCAFAVMLGGWIGSGVAVAAAPGEAVYASSCQNGYAEYDNFVASFNVPVGVVDAMLGRSHTVSLFCGRGEHGVDGVLHIIGGARPHPIRAQDDEVFEECLEAIFREGRPTNADAGNLALAKTLRSGAVGTVVWNSTSNRIVTAYTSDGPQGNNWSGCAAG